jgi:uncharacterized RDD family membrane protein YckC
MLFALGALVKTTAKSFFLIVGLVYKSCFTLCFFNPDKKELHIMEYIGLFDFI